MFSFRRVEFYTDANYVKLICLYKMMSVLRSIRGLYNFSNSELFSVLKCFFIKVNKNF
ncbi:hypothetical protein ONB70_01600 [Candidatus Purcelliella pentastirinorum]|uniref:hypothetical protein n=1 Tax=Candidatus Purcelliella pentastirinorum TaxID=472834 RepID=UPI00237A3DBB|nr:hypothetical protein [Candidatus Purcelliella pentastirinorum]WDR80385.1 hypothetical protein ONB70_01600 [Candidatus Purcelliella pentastirinorum]